MLFRSLGDKVLVIPAPVTTETKSGLLLSEKSRERPVRGEIVAIGSEVKEAKVGDIALYGKYVGCEAEQDGHHFVILREVEIHAVI